MVKSFIEYLFIGFGLEAKQAGECVRECVEPESEDEVNFWPSAGSKYTRHEWTISCSLKCPEAGPSSAASSTWPQRTWWWNLRSANSLQGFQKPVQMSVYPGDLQFTKPTFSCWRWPVSRVRRKGECKEQTPGAMASWVRCQLTTVGVSSDVAHCRAACCSMWCTPSWACRCRTAGSQRKR